jgi:hypothetical protein
MIQFKDLVGKVLSDVRNNNNEEIIFVTEDGESYKLYHSQDCCESVTVEDIAGDLKDLVGSPITKAEESESRENPPGVDMGAYQESFTWTFYQLATVNGYVTIRWYGSSNGWYSESVSFCKL